MAADQAGWAFRAVRQMELMGPPAVSFLSSRLMPRRLPDDWTIQGWIEQLGSPRYTDRLRAYEHLAQLGPAVEPALREALRGAESCEARRRMEQLLASAAGDEPQTAEQRRIRLALRTLERIGTEDACRVLARLAGGAPLAMQTRWARQALERIDTRRQAPPAAAQTALARRGPGRVAWRLDLGEFCYPRTEVNVVDGVAYFGVDDATVGPRLGSYLTAVDVQRRTVLWRHGSPQLTIRTRPAVSNGLVYVSTRHDETGPALSAMDAATGQTRWRFPTAPHPHTAPRVHGATVYFATADGRAYAVDAALGQLVWSRPCEGRIEHPVATDGRRVIVSAGRRLVAMSARTGELLWELEAGQSAGAAVLDGDRVVALLRDHEHGRGRLVALDAGNGRVLWQHDMTVVSLDAPAITDGTVYAVGRSRQTLRAVDAEAGTLRWTLEMPAPVAHRPVVDDAMLYLVGRDDGHLRAVDLAQRELSWTMDLHCRRVWGPPTVEGGMLYVGSRRWKFVALTDRPTDDQLAAADDEPR